MQIGIFINVVHTHRSSLLAMNRFLFAAFVLLLLVVTRVGQASQLSVASGTISEITTAAGERFSKVIITKHVGDRISFEHEAGLETRRLTEFDETNLDRLFPGLLAKKAAAIAAREREEHAREQVVAEQVWKSPLEQQSLEKRLQAAIAEALHPTDTKTFEDEPFVCIVVSGNDNYELGDVPQIAVRIINQSSKEVYLVRMMDGSDGRRFPQCHWSFTDPSGKPVENIGSFCGTHGSLGPAHFVAVPPGGVFDPQVHEFLLDQFSRELKQPGTYKVSFRYSTASRTIEDYFGSDFLAARLHGQPYQVGGAIQRLFERVEHIEVQSKTLKLVFKSRAN